MEPLQSALLEEGGWTNIEDQEEEESGGPVRTRGAGKITPHRLLPYAHRPTLYTCIHLHIYILKHSVFSTSLPYTCI